MIGRIKGILVLAENGEAVIDVNGVGYIVRTTRETLQEISKNKQTPVTLWTYHVVREDSSDLYGFPDRETLRFFEALLSVSGIGPKSAINILNVAPVKSIQSAIVSGDPTHLTKTTGIGTKKAEKIILELRDKLDVLEGELDAHRETNDVIDALQALGYSRKEAQDALKKVPSTGSAEIRIKEALKLLGK
ncbi:MAG: Holliday junction DNA helicase RuvA [Candidatus Taylorbacteria bacterium RIFCSPHIGHO2_01_FULL_46_22b]|uniref:Holliday junction branch migration complex subunit RuvA n=1 Tax=Candidatus Taylorbacteria bacterium RIFCSPHIGHO2_01_FULL_46_22b TaxID=1802301 RepID=A0A1G2M4M4_9BACT|nr:MAG: Holliday junction DNA helicase RuvA [Candidatus Taylorbacteria bacterium RIFCSPHIGHO2_01_FULL_46_22b]